MGSQSAVGEVGRDLGRASVTAWTGGKAQRGVQGEVLDEVLLQVRAWDLSTRNLANKCLSS